jgi:micrococcal nuclease
MEHRYVYKAAVHSVYDGDTIRVNIDLGCKIWINNEIIRLAGINAPEIRGEERQLGLVSRDWLRNRIPPGTDIVIETVKDKREKYGRYLGVIFVDGVNINQQMIDLGLAESFMT